MGREDKLSAFAYMMSQLAKEQGIDIGESYHKNMIKQILNNRYGIERGNTMKETLIKKKIDNLIFETKEDAESVLNTLRSNIEKYGGTSVADFYDISGVTSNINDHKYGWTNLDEVQVLITYRGTMLYLPIPVTLDAKPEPILFKVPNKDTYFSPGMMCPKEVLLKAYTDKVGKSIDYCGDIKKIVSVKVTENDIIVELE